MATGPRFQIIFDLDDTLIASFECFCAVHRRAARALGHRVLSDEELVAYDTNLRVTLERQYSDVPSFDAQRFIDKWDEIADEHPYQPIEGAAQALSALSRAGHELWIVTSRSRARLAQRMKEGGLLARWFRGVFPRDDQPMPKPDPRCFEPVWRTLGRRPGEAGFGRVLYVGDRDMDRRAAEAARVPFVAVRTGPEVMRGFPFDMSPRFVLESAAALPAWLETHDDE